MHKHTNILEENMGESSYLLGCTERIPKQDVKPQGEKMDRFYYIKITKTSVLQNKTQFKEMQHSGKTVTTHRASKN